MLIVRCDILIMVSGVSVEWDLRAMDARPRNRRLASERLNRVIDLVSRLQESVQLGLCWSTHIVLARILADGFPQRNSER
ncbi:MAG: hypothetical protein KatS3mg087_1235 [Patescibacteria group bacterium]|nr:MAG: hypothetical protein KatS3mg087_1235 [Patescibacteria group bacterium]